MKKRVLITGTTSGLGRSLAKLYSARGAEVTCVNRRADPAPVGAVECVMDISDRNLVRSLVVTLAQQNRLPDIFVLNAGINRIDFDSHFNFEEFQNVMSTNLNGVLTFVDAVQSLNIRGVTLCAMSSVSNIVPNPRHMGYYGSKWMLFKMFRFFSKLDLQNKYKVVLLGPVHTNITSGYSGPQGAMRRLFNLLAVTSDDAAAACEVFFARPGFVLRYPAFTFIFYKVCSLLISLLPRLYQPYRSCSRAPGSAPT